MSYGILVPVVFLSPDRRSFASAEEKLQHCICCDKDLVVLPNDRRRGYCFDCLCLSGSTYDRCPQCQTFMDDDPPFESCSRCGWSRHSS
jgi:hypothetical protein